MECGICASESVRFAHHVIMGKYDVSYYRCPVCGFVQTEPPYWLDESYSEAINASDTGLVSRNIALSKLTKAVVALFFNGDGAFLDYGGGYGLLVRMMRDMGLDFYRHDKFCPNLFAKGFDSEEPPGKKYELLTSFEVFEHLTSPVEEVGRMLELSENILFTTDILPEPCPAPGEWWYYGLDHGQHVSFYTTEALRRIADRYDLNLYSHWSAHLFTRKKVSSVMFKLACSNMGRQLLCAMFRRESLLQRDWIEYMGKEK